VLVSTGLTEETAMRRFAGADVAGFIQKPYTLHAGREDPKRLEVPLTQRAGQVPALHDGMSQSYRQEANKNAPTEH